MSKKRVSKSITRMLEDLDDHLFLLKEAHDRIESGEKAYLKALAAELRVLICYSSRTEGLLWRMIDELGSPDSVHVHLAGNVDRDHPLARGLHFVWAPVLRAGKGDPRLPPDHYSLRQIIKHHEAVFVSGNGYTHEALIKDFAQQIGSAHEDDGVDPYLIELGETIIKDISPLIAVLLSDTSYVLEIGERLLVDAAEQHDYEMKPRARYSMAEPATSELQKDEQEVEGQAPGFTDEGTVMFLVDHADGDWRTNEKKYTFGRVTNGNVTLEATKHPDRMIEIAVSGLTEHPVIVRKSLKEIDQPGVMIAVTWKSGQISTYVNGQIVDS